LIAPNFIESRGRRKKESLRNRAALSTAVSTILAMVILVAALGGYYVLSQTGVTSSQTSSTGSTSSVTGTASHNPVYYSWNLQSGYQISLRDLIGNYSQMKYSMTTKGLNYSESANETVSYLVVGHPVLAGGQTTEVVSNSTLVAVSAGVRVVDQSVSNVLWMAANGTVVRAEENGTIENGIVADPDSLLTPVELGGPFDFAADILSLNSTLIAAVNSSSTQVGPTQVSTTTYEPTTQLAYRLVPFGLGYSVTVEVGIATGDSFYIPIYVSIFGPPLLNGFQSQVALTTIDLLSVTPA